MSKKKAKKSSKPAQTADTPDVMTILIHGTFNSTHHWYQPGSRMHSYLRSLFPNDYFEMDAGADFNWAPALPNKMSRREGAEDLFCFCERYHTSKGVKQFRLIGHSHGCSVASICSHYWAAARPNWTIKSLVFLAPLQGRRFPADHLPNLAAVDDSCFYNLHAKVDLVVGRNNQNFQRVPHLRDHEREVEYPRLGHWEPTKPEIWRESGFETLVKRGC